MQRRYCVVDAFSTTPLMGNPVAVVLDADGLTDQQMAAIARWTNLSETTFVLPVTDAKADYRVRIFTPSSELPFAGHPTLGTAHAVMEAGIAKTQDGKIVQECGVGLIDVSVSANDSGRQLALTLPPAEVIAISGEDTNELEAILGHPVLRASPPAIIDVGAVWAVAEVESIDALLALNPDYARSATFERLLGLTGLSIFAIDSITGNVETRSFAPSCGVNEDPVCGSGNGSVAAFRVRAGQLAKTSWTYIAHQGQKVGREGVVALSADSAGIVRVGGGCVTTVSGTLDL